MPGIFPRDPIGRLRIVALVVCEAWAVLGPYVDDRFALAAGAVLMLSIVLARGVELRGRPAGVLDLPGRILLLDLLAISLWSVANAANPRGIAAFGILLSGAFAVARLDRLGLVLVLAAYAAARTGQELIRSRLGIGTEQPALVAEVPFVLITFGALIFLLRAFETERARTRRALDRARTLERLATEIAAATDTATTVAQIAAAALDLSEADHATVDVRRGASFECIAGAGSGTHLVGLRSPATTGLAADVQRALAPVLLADAARHPSIEPDLLALGLHPMLGVPILGEGNIAVAYLLVGRRAHREFDAADAELLVGLAAHAATALRNARLLAHGARVERLTVALMRGTQPAAALDAIAAEVIDALAVEAAAVVAITAERSTVVGAAGLAVMFRGDAPDELAALLRRIAATGESVLWEAPAGAAAGAAPGLAGLLGLASALTVPVTDAGLVLGALVVATTDPYRRFDPLDQRSLRSFAEVAAPAVRRLRG